MQRYQYLSILHCIIHFNVTCHVYLTYFDIVMWQCLWLLFPLSSLIANIDNSQLFLWNGLTITLKVMCAVIIGLLSYSTAPLCTLVEYSAWSLAAEDQGSEESLKWSLLLITLLPLTILKAHWNRNKRNWIPVLFLLSEIQIPGVCTANRPGERLLHIIWGVD